MGGEKDRWKKETKLKSEKVRQRVSSTLETAMRSKKGVRKG